MTDLADELTKVGSGEEPLQQFADREAGRLRCEDNTADAEVVDQLPPSLLGYFLVPADGEGALDAAGANRVEANDHPDLPDARGPLAN